MTVPVVEKNIPLPLKFPFDQMELGDSFAIPSEIKRATVAVYARRFGDKHGMKFITRQMPDGTIRCWRTK